MVALINQRYFLQLLKALNKLIQGSAADMTKKAMLELYKEGIIPHIQVHDELVFEVPDDDIDEMKNIVISNMESAALPLVNFKVPLKVDTKISNSWDSA